MTLHNDPLRGAAGAGGGGADGTVNFVNSYVDGGDSTAFSLTISTGDVSESGLATRYLVAAVNVGNQTNTPTSVTLMGQTANLVVKDNVPDKASYIYITDNPVALNSSFKINVESTATYNRIGVGLWEVFDCGATADNTNGSTASLALLNLNTLVGGVSIGGINRINISSSTWTGLIRDYDTAGGDTGGGHSGASIAHSSASTPFAITAGPSLSAVSAHFPKA